MNEPKIKRWFRSLVDEGKIQQEPMNYDAATLKIYIDHLEKENAALRERLEKAVELPCAKVVKTKEWIDRVEVGDIIWEWAVIYIDRQGEFVVEPCRSKIAAETRLRELQGENQ